MTSEEKALALQKRHNLTGITFDLVAVLDQHAEEQRQICADAVMAECNASHTPDLKRACLNATREE